MNNSEVREVRVQVRVQGSATVRAPTWLLLVDASECDCARTTSAPGFKIEARVKLNG